MPYDEQGLYYPATNPILDAINSGQPLPELTPTATAADRDLYRYIQDPDALPALFNGNLWVGDAPNQNYPQGGIYGQSIYDAYETGQITDPNLQLYIQQQLNNVNRKDQYSPFGDQFTTALLGLGLAVGGAGAYGGLAAGGGGGAVGAGAATGAVGSAGAGASTPLLAAATPEFTAPFAGTVLEGLAPDVLAGLGFGTGLEGLGGAGVLGATTVSGGETLLSPLPEGAGVLPGGGAASPELIAGVGANASGGLLGSGSGVLGTSITLGDLVKVGVPALTSLIGSAVSGNAAGNAAQTQANAAQAANTLLGNIYTQNRTDLLPYTLAGVTALPALSSLATQSPTQAPYTPTAPLSPSAYAFQAPTVTDDPGYRFRVSEGQKALERNLAAQGKSLSGQALKELTTYGQGQASQEYQAAYQRSLLQNQLAYERAQAENQQQEQRGSQAYQTNFNVANTLNNRQFQQLSTLANIGRGATADTTNLAAALGNTQAGNITSAGAVNAAGQVGQSNALNTGLAGINNAVQQYYLYQLLQQGRQ